MATEQQTPTNPPEVDEYIWLEDIYGEAPLAWVAEQNQVTSRMLATPAFERTQQQILEVLDSTERIPMVTRYGAFLYNFWKDAEHPRGLWRRTSLEQYRAAQPAWETVLDVDSLGKSEGTDWVFAGAQLLYPEYERALLHLSPDGGDAVTIREFDVSAKTFVEGGFVLPTAKTRITWSGHDSVLVATDFGPGTLTTSSYPRQIKRWRRGLPIESAELVFEVPVDHMLAVSDREHAEGFERDTVVDFVDFFHHSLYLLQDGQPVRIAVPDDATAELHREWLLIRPRTDWVIGEKTYVAGSLLAAKVEEYLAGGRDLDVLFAPDDQTSLDNWSWTKHHLILNELRDVSSRIEILTPGDSGWSRQPLDGAPALHVVSASGVDDDTSDDFWLIVSGFLTPTTLQLGTVGGGTPETLKTAPSFFDERRFSVEQHFVASKDGTRVPYFQVSSRDLVLDGSHPTLLSGYGGFEIARTPAYSGSVGRAWLERGGVYVVANIRGGGEYGPRWHLAALKQNRHRAYEDFAAVAQDLIDRGVTSATHLGCEGGSNGGLLVGNMLTHYSHLFGAIACEVPLLDMQRYVKLSAGASWIAEYGDPGVPEEWAFIQTFSPYHNLHADETYPPVLFYTATSDDRVGPVQARKMAARMQALGIPNVWFYENREGGHGAAADNQQSAHLHAAAYEFLWDRLQG